MNSWIEEDKISKAIVKLIRKTQANELKWETTTKQDIQLGLDEYLIGKVFRTQAMGRNLRLYKYKYKMWTDYDEFGWLEGTRLEFVDSHDLPEWSFPGNYSIQELYEAVSYQISKVDEFLDVFLEEEPARW